MNDIEYTKNYFDLKSVFKPDRKEIKIPGSEITIMNQEFSSFIDIRDPSGIEDSSISENSTFSYPVFVPGDRSVNKVILLLHGLNERSWVKYLVWAYWLCQKTGSYVILFPISYHINRSPSSWIDPRQMIVPLKERNNRYSEITMSSFANIALSNRLTDDPMRFFRSGYQTAFDIVRLTDQIKNGEMQLIPEGSNINIFAYSIGAFLAQILMMGNPEGLFTDSKLFMFCGGSVFSNMQGTSKLIMDSLAYQKVYNFYLDEFESTITKRNPFFDFLLTSQVGIAFRAMIDTSRFKAFRENILLKLKDQIRTIALLKDRVIPAEGIVRTMNAGFKKHSSVEVWDFPYGYSHENPFPVADKLNSPNVDRWFEKMISEACLFLA
jgi:hypothetical protein